MIFSGSNCQWASSQPFTVMDVVIDCLTGEDSWHVASLTSREWLLLSYYVCKVKEIAYCCLCGLCRPRIVTGCNHRGVVRLHGRIAWRRWHLTLSILSPLIMCINQTYCYLSHKYQWESCYNHFSLCTEVVKKVYRNGPPSCTEVVQADLACSSCTEIGLYWSRPPPSRSGHVPNWS